MTQTALCRSTEMWAGYFSHFRLWTFQLKETIHSLSKKTIHMWGVDFPLLRWPLCPVDFNSLPQAAVKLPTSTTSLCAPANPFHRVCFTLQGSWNMEGDVLKGTFTRKDNGKQLTTTRIVQGDELIQVCVYVSAHQGTNNLHFYTKHCGKLLQEVLRLDLAGTQPVL